MAVFRVKKTKDFTVMSNHHLKDKNISLKAKGLLSVMLSLPEEWNYSLSGLAKLTKEGVDAIRTVINELEQAGYIVRNRLRNEKGQLKDTEYVIHEVPIEKPTQAEPILENPTLDIPTLEEPMQDEPTLESPIQLNTNKTNTNELNTDCIKYPSINKAAPEVSEVSLEERVERRKEIRKKAEAEIKEQIDYDYLVAYYDRVLVDEVVNTMVNVMTVYKPKYRIDNYDIPCEDVILNFKRITTGELEAFLMNYADKQETIKNPTKYLISSLYNTPSSAGFSMTNRINCDMTQ